MSVYVLPAQPQYRFEHFTTNNGLSQASIYAMQQDSRGFMWFGSWDGLNRFDGYNFTVFKPSPKDSNAIEGSRITNIIEDANQQLWVGTYRALNCYDYYTNSFKKYYVKFNGETRKGRYYPFFIDDKHELWFTFEKSLFSINLKSHIITPYPFANDRLEEFATGGYPRYGFYKPLKFVYSSGHDGLRIIDLKAKSIRYYFSENKNNLCGNKKLIWVTFPDEENRIWLASESGLILLDENNFNFKIFESSIDDLKPVALTSVIQDNKKQLWCGTDGNGLWLFDKQKEKFIQIFKKDLNNSESLSENTITSLYVDKQQNIWINADPQSIDKINPFYQQLTHVREVGNNIKLLSKVVWSITKVGNYDLLVCYNQSGLVKYNLQNGSAKLIKLPKRFKETSVYHAITDSKKTTWMASDAGLFYSHNGLETIEKFNNRPYYYVYLYEFKNSIIAGADQITITIKKNGNKFVTDTIAFFNKKNVSVIGTASNNKLAIATYSNELFFLDSTYSGKLDITDSFQFDFLVKTIYTQNDSIMWLGTNVGLVKFNILNQSKTIFDESSGLANSYVYGLLYGNDGMLWMSTNRGISSFNLTTQKFVNYGLAEGVQGWEFNSRSFFQSSDSTIFFGGINGFNFYNPKKLINIAFEPYVQIEKILVNNEPVPISNFFKSSNPAMLKSSQNDLSFDFAAIDFIRNNNIGYMYRLRTTDSWTNIGNSRNIRFADLENGDYILQVKAVYTNNVASPNILTVPFTILPPVYLRWWFYLIVITSTLAIIYFIYKIRIKQLLKLQNVRNAIARDLHDDIGSTLSSIGNYSDVAISKIDKQQYDIAKQVLNKTSSTSREMIERMGDIVWSINSINDNFESLISRMRSFASLSLNPIGIEYTFQIDGQIQHITADQRKNIYLIFKEVLNNTIKHANCKNVTIKIVATKKVFEMLISDNGRGFNYQNLNHQSLGGMGLKNIQSRAKEINGRIDITSNIGTGTIINLRLVINN